MVTYNLDIPDGPNNPSNDQPKMKTNTNAIQTLVAVDHVGFNTNGLLPNGIGGQHLQVSFGGKNTPGAPPTDPLSILYTQSGVASPVAQLWYVSQNNDFQVSPVKAWGFINGLTGAIINNQHLNISSVARTPMTLEYPVTLQSNAVTGQDFGVVVSTSKTGPGGPIIEINYFITGAAAFTIYISGGQAPPNFTFQVIQV